MRMGSSSLLALLTSVSTGCVGELPPSTPFVDIGMRDLDRGGRADVTVDAASLLDRGVARDVAVSDATLGDAFVSLDLSSDFQTMVDLGELDGGPEDLAFDFGHVDDGLDSSQPPDLEPLDLSPPEPDMRPPLVREVCNGLDDDADRAVDEEPNCGPAIVERCRVFLGFQNFFGSPGAFDEWGACPGATTDALNPPVGDYTGCVGTQNDTRFRRLAVDGINVDADDTIAVAFICDDDALSRWFEAHCEVLFGQADNTFGHAPESRDEWLALPDEDPAAFASVTSGGDGRFHAMSLLGDVNDDDAFAIAFRCDDPAQPERAAAAQASAAVILGWADQDMAPPDRSESWMPGCPAQDNTALAAADGIGCAGSNFDGRFYRIDLSGNVDGNDALGIALLPRPPRDAPPR